MTRLIFSIATIMFSGAHAFVVPATQTYQRQRSPIVWQSAFDDIQETVQDQVSNGAPLVEQAKQAGYNLPGLHWGHGTVMAIVFVTMGLTGKCSSRLRRRVMSMYPSQISHTARIRRLVGMADSPR